MTRRLVCLLPYVVFFGGVGVMISLFEELPRMHWILTIPCLFSILGLPLAAAEFVNKKIGN